MFSSFRSATVIQLSLFCVGVTTQFGDNSQQTGTYVIVYTKYSTETFFISFNPLKIRLLFTFFAVAYKSISFLNTKKSYSRNANIR